jgi:hypothetical protein
MVKAEEAPKNPGNYDKSMPAPSSRHRRRPDRQQLEARTDDRFTAPPPVSAPGEN